MLSQNRLEALQQFKKSEYDKFCNELQNRVNKVFNDKFKDARKVIPLYKVNSSNYILNIVIYLKFVLIS